MMFMTPQNCASKVGCTEETPDKLKSREERNTWIG
jgi:hypothetical protein